MVLKDTLSSTVNEPMPLAGPKEWTPAYISDSHESHAQELMLGDINLEIARLNAKLDIQRTTGGGFGYLATALAQAEKDRDAIAKIIGLDIAFPDMNTVAITGRINDNVVDLKGTLGVTRGVPSCLEHPAGKTIRPQIVEAGGTLGSQDISGTQAILEMGRLMYFLQIRQRRADRLRAGIPPHMSA